MFHLDFHLFSRHQCVSHNRFVFWGIKYGFSSNIYIVNALVLEHFGDLWYSPVISLQDGISKSRILGKLLLARGREHCVSKSKKR